MLCPRRASAAAASKAAAMPSTLAVRLPTIAIGASHGLGEIPDDAEVSRRKRDRSKPGGVVVVV